MALLTLSLFLTLHLIYIHVRSIFDSVRKKLYIYIYGFALLILLETLKLNRVRGWAKNHDTDQSPTTKSYSKPLNMYNYTFSVTLDIFSIFPFILIWLPSFNFIHHYMGAYTFENDLHRNSEGPYVLRDTKLNETMRLTCCMRNEIGSIGKKSW